MILQIFIDGNTNLSSYSAILIESSEIDDVVKNQNWTGYNNGTNTEKRK